MNIKQGGFTLIELVVVIVILGILSATALPKFIDLRTDAGTAAAAGVAGGLASGSAINYAGKIVNKSVTPASLSGTGSAVCDSTAVAGLLTSGWPSGFTIAAVSSAATCASGGVMECTVTNSSGGTGATAGMTCY